MGRRYATQIIPPLGGLPWLTSPSGGWTGRAFMCLQSILSTSAIALRTWYFNCLLICPLLPIKFDLLEERAWILFIVTSADPSTIANIRCNFIGRIKEQYGVNVQVKLKKKKGAHQYKVFDNDCNWRAINNGSLTFNPSKYIIKHLGMQSWMTKLLILICV